VTIIDVCSRGRECHVYKTVIVILISRPYAIVGYVNVFQLRKGGDENAGQESRNIVFSHIEYLQLLERSCNGPKQKFCFSLEIVVPQVDLGNQTILVARNTKPLAVGS